MEERITKWDAGGGQEEQYRGALEVKEQCSVCWRGTRIVSPIKSPLLFVTTIKSVVSRGVPRLH